MPAMKKKILLTFTLVFALSIISCNKSNRTDASQEAPRERPDSVEQDNVEVENKLSATYSCPVHAEIIKDKPGVCPKCNRTLVQVND